MLPGSFATIYALLGLVAPGLLFQWLRERHLPLPERSPFREASRIALSSLIFSWLSIMVLALVSKAAPTLLVDLASWLEDGHTYIGEHLWLVAWSATVEVGLACAIAWFAALMLNRLAKSKSEASPIVYTTPWYEVLQASMTGDDVPWVLVTLTDGTKIWGKVHRYTLAQVGSDERQIALCGPGLATQRPGKGRKEEDYWKYILVDGSDISLMKVATSK
jgi:hypothetical protein